MLTKPIGNDRKITWPTRWDCVRPRRLRSSALLGILPMLLFVVGCTETLAPRIHRLPMPAPKAHQMAALSPADTDLSSAASTHAGLGTYPFPEGVLAGVQIAGVIHVWNSSQASCIHMPGNEDDVDYGGVNEFCGTNAHCVWGATINSRGVSTPAQACPSTPPGPYYSKRSAWVDTILVGGSGAQALAEAVRGPSSLESNVCGSGPCHIVSGSQHVTLSPLAGDLDVRGFYSGQAGRTVVVPPFTHTIGYYSIAFRDSATPRAARNTAMPFQAISWAWHKADPAAVADPFWHSTDIAQCPTRLTAPLTSNTCNLDVKESGVLTSVTRVNGVSHTDSVCVQCSVTDPQGAIPDSILNLQVVRTAMMQLADSTNGHDPNPNLRREQVAVVIRDNSTGQVTVYTQLQDSSKQCLSWWRPITPAELSNTEIVLAYIHTHPIVAGERIRCDATHSTNRNPAPSDSDIVARNNVNSRADYIAAGWAPDWYVVSMDGVFKMDATNSRRSQNSVAEWYHGLCAWVRSDDHNGQIIRRNW
jgi:hypothetical protein